MKIIYVFLLAAAAVAPFLADSQTLPPSGRSIPSTRQPVPAIWQPLPGNNRVVPGNVFIFKQSPTPTQLNTDLFNAPARVWDRLSGSDRTLRHSFPSELPFLRYEDLRGKDGHLHAPLPPGVTLRTSRPDPIRVLRPDNMPCRMTDLARLERMPVRRTNNADPMNRLTAPFHVQAYGIK